MTAPATLADWLPHAAAHAYAKAHAGAALPQTLANRLTVDALADWLAASAPFPNVERIPADVGGLAAPWRDYFERLYAGALAVFTADPPRGMLEVRKAFNRATLDTGPLADALAAAHTCWGIAARHDRDLKHPVAALLEAWIEAHRPAATVDRWARPTMPRMVTQERVGESPRIEAPDGASERAESTPTIPGGLGLVELPAAPTFEQAHLPTLAPPSMPSGVIPAAWLTLIDGFARAHSDPREWQRALRLLIEILAKPDPRERRGVVRVELDIGGPDGAIRRLWPKSARVREHYPALRRALGLVVSAALPTAAEGFAAFVPAQLARWQRADMLTFNVTYPVDGGNGAAFDWDAFRRYGPNPGLLRVYLASVWAMDAPRLQAHADTVRGERVHALPLDGFARLAHYPDRAATSDVQRQWRQRMKHTIAKLANDGVLAYALEGSGCGQRLALWTPRALPQPE